MKSKHLFWMKIDRRGPRQLTLQELIVSSDFDAMMREIVAFHPKMEGLDAHFYRSYQYIKNMKLKPHCEDYILAEYDQEYNMPYIGVLEGMHWRECLCYPVKKAKGLKCSDTVLAAHCLWHLTFYGFTPEEQRANFDRENEEIERERRNDELYLCDDIYSDEEIKESAWLGYSRIKDEVLERLFTPEEIIEIKKIHKKRLDEENARYDAAEEEERKQLEQEATLKMELKKKAEREKRERWLHEQRRKRHKHRTK